MTKGKLAAGETIVGRGRTVKRHYPGDPPPKLTGPQRAEAFCREILKSADTLPEWVGEGAAWVLGDESNNGQDWSR